MKCTESEAPLEEKHACPREQITAARAKQHEGEEDTGIEVRTIINDVGGTVRKCSTSRWQHGKT